MTAQPENSQAQAPAPRCRILVVGVGGGACNVVSRALAGWTDAPLVAGINTDAPALAQSDVALKLAIGKNVTKGMGTGGDVEVGRLAASEDLDALRNLVAGHDLLLLVAGLGGGTATGAAPVLARVAREEGLLVLAYVTLPFAFEGARRQEQAQEGLATLKRNADAVVCLPNQRLHSLLPPDTSLPDAFAFVDRMMVAGIRGLWTLLAQNNMLNLDFSDVQTLVENSGNECCFGYGEGAGAGKTEQALQNLLAGPMLDKGRVLANSGAMILGVIGGPDLSLAELSTIHERFTAASRPGARISLGAAVLDDWPGRLALIVLAVEHWLPPPKPGALVIEAGHTGPSAEPAGRRRAGRGQSELPLAPAPDRGRFQNVSPTLHDGADLDIPTYIRRNIRIPT